MYAYIRGILTEITPTHAILDVSGVGYKIGVPISYVNKLLTLHQELTLQTSWVVRETSWALFGFLTGGERDLFEVLIGVSGIGPKTALALLGHLSMRDLQDAVRRNDLLMLSKVPGVGKKTAERLIVDLRGKIDHFEAPVDGRQTPSRLTDALQALLNLGYSHASAKIALDRALKEVSAETDLSALLAAALKSGS